MDRTVRDRFATTTHGTTDGNACWETAPAVFRRIEEDFGPFDVDLFADAARHCCPTWYGPDSPVGLDDALTARWAEYGVRGYGNPPYGAFIPQALAKAEEESRVDGFVSVLLLPLRITKAFHRYVVDRAAELWLPDRRLIFWEHGAPRYTFDKKRQRMRDKPDAAMFDSMIVKFDARARSHRDVIVRTWPAPSHEEQARA